MEEWLPGEIEKLLMFQLVKEFLTYKVVDRSDPLIETALALGVYVGDIKWMFTPIEKISNLQEFKKIFLWKNFCISKIKNIKWISHTNKKKVQIFMKVN